MLISDRQAAVPVASEPAIPVLLPALPIPSAGHIVRHRRQQSGQTNSRYALLPPFWGAPVKSSKRLAWRHYTTASAPRTCDRDHKLSKFFGRPSGRETPAFRPVAPRSGRLRSPPQSRPGSEREPSRRPRERFRESRRAPSYGLFIIDKSDSCRQISCAAAGGAVFPQPAEPGRRAIRPPGRRARFRGGIRAMRAFSAAAFRSAARRRCPKTAMLLSRKIIRRRTARPPRPTAPWAGSSRSCSRGDSAAGARESGKCAGISTSSDWR